VKAVVERHRGQVTVTSEEGKGSVFGMELPREKTPG
jgi:signal transduction histidine kinase